MHYGSGPVVRQALLRAAPWQRVLIGAAMVAGGVVFVLFGHVAGVLLAGAGALLLWRMVRERPSGRPRRSGTASRGGREARCDSRHRDHGSCDRPPVVVVAAGLFAVGSVVLAACGGSTTGNEASHGATTSGSVVYRWGVVGNRGRDHQSPTGPAHRGRRRRGTRRPDRYLELRRLRPHLDRSRLRLGREQLRRARGRNTDSLRDEGLRSRLSGRHQDQVACQPDAVRRRPGHRLDRSRLGLGPQRLRRPLPLRCRRIPPATTALLGRHARNGRPDPRAVRLERHRVRLRERGRRRAGQRFDGLHEFADARRRIAGRRQGHRAHLVLGGVRGPAGQRRLLQLGVQRVGAARQRLYRQQCRPREGRPAERRQTGVPGRKRREERTDDRHPSRRRRLGVGRQ